MSISRNLITSPSVREICGGVCEMTLHRWVNSPEYSHLGFPKPAKIANRNYWRLGDIESWIESQINPSNQAA